MNCRHCKNSLKHIFLDLGFAPPSNAYLSEEDLQRPEQYYPLKLFVCNKCWLVQTDDCTDADDLFRPNYAYFSSVSSSWLAHAAAYVDMIRHRLALNNQSFVIELASNDGYLLKNFITAGIPCLGIEPTEDTSIAAEKLGVPVLKEFFCKDIAVKLVSENKKADLILGNNVYAHVPDINDFTLGMKLALKTNGTITLEFPHLMQLINNKQFDTVYHEHFSYLSLGTVAGIFESAGLRVFDVEELPTHGGSLRIYGCHTNDTRETSENVANLHQREQDNGLQTLDHYLRFQECATQIKTELLSFLIDKKKERKTVVAYGAAAKGNTLLNYSGIKPDLLQTIYDAAPSKQNRFMPGSHIPILDPVKLKESKPDFVLILPWNISAEVIEQHSYIADWGGKFVVSIPELQVL